MRAAKEETEDPSVPMQMLFTRECADGVARGAGQKYLATEDNAALDVEHDRAKKLAEHKAKTAPKADDEPKDEVKDERPKRHDKI